MGRQRRFPRQIWRSARRNLVLPNPGCLGNGFLRGQTAGSNHQSTPLRAVRHVITSAPGGGWLHLASVNPETVKQFAIFIASLVMDSFILLRIGESDNLPLELVPVFLRTLIGLSRQCVVGLTLWRCCCWRGFCQGYM